MVEENVMKKEKYVYSSLKSRIQAEWKIYVLAFVFILIADSIGQIKIPLGPGNFILFPIFYALILGVLSGPQVTKIEGSKSSIKTRYCGNLSVYCKAWHQCGSQH